MNVAYLISALLVATPQQSAPEASQPTFVTYVRSREGKCVYQTGDVGLSAAQFEDHLRRYFEKNSTLMIYYGENSHSCVMSALSMAVRMGFREVRTAKAPRDLDMGPT